MDYPPPPWRLCGEAYGLLQRLPVTRARAFVPPGLAIVPVLPGRTLGGLYLAAYHEGSVLRYHELLIVAALVRRGRRLGAWISHAYVDEPRSVAGGRAIWGLPKELATFDWDRPAGRVVVRQGERAVCAWGIRRPRAGLRLPLVLPAFGRRGHAWLAFRGEGTARVGMARLTLEIPADSPIAALGFTAGTGLHLRELRLGVRAPMALSDPGA